MICRSLRDDFGLTVQCKHIDMVYDRKIKAQLQ